MPPIETTQDFLRSTSDQHVQYELPHTSHAQLLDESHFNEVEDFPPFDEIQHGELLALRLGANTTDYTHGLHRFPAKFVPQIPRWALREFAQPSNCVLDPYMGSGTTLVEALIAGCHAVGTDIDPLARLIARAKTSEASSQRLTQLGIELRKRWENHLCLKQEILQPPMPDIDNFEHWFALKTWHELSTLRDAVQELTCSEEEHTFLWAVFSSILRWVSNADDQSQKTYVSGTHRKKPRAVTTTFWHNFDRALRGLHNLEQVKHSQAHREIPDGGDAMNLPLSPRSVDLIVTSPPYLDSVDYMYNSMAEYFWLGPMLGLPTRQAFNEYRRRPTGAKNPRQGVYDLPANVQHLVDNSILASGRKRAAVAYFHHMQSHFMEAARVLKPGARYVLVVGNSQTSSNILPVHKCLLQLAQPVGLHMEKAFGMRIRRHYMKFPRKGRGGIIVMDWVIVMRRCTEQCSCSSTPAPLHALPLPWFTLPHDSVAN